MLQFVKLTEKNDHEGETWHYWLQWDGNTEELKKLDGFLAKHAGDDEDFSYELFHYTRYEDEVDILVDESDWGYMKTHQKFKGRLNLGDLSLVEPDDILYKGRIERFFE